VHQVVLVDAGSDKGDIGARRALLGSQLVERRNRGDVRVCARISSPQPAGDQGIQCVPLGAGEAKTTHHDVRPDRGELCQVGGRQDGGVGAPAGYPVGREWVIACDG